MSTRTIPMLYGIAFETWDLLGGRQVNVKADIQYEKAQEPQEAKMTFLRMRPNITLALQRRRARIIAIAPVLGYYVEDRDEKRLSVT